MVESIQLLLLVGLSGSKATSNTLTSLLLMIIKAVLEMATAHPYSIDIGRSGPFSQNGWVSLVVSFIGRNSLVYGLLVPPMMYTPLVNETTEE